MTRRKRMTPDIWRVVGERIREWAGSDAGSDELHALADHYGITSLDSEWWDEFRKRVERGFGPYKEKRHG